MLSKKQLLRPQHTYSALSRTCWTSCILLLLLCHMRLFMLPRLLLLHALPLLVCLQLLLHLLSTRVMRLLCLLCLLALQVLSLLCLKRAQVWLLEGGVTCVALLIQQLAQLLLCMPLLLLVDRVTAVLVTPNLQWVSTHLSVRLCPTCMDKTVAVARRHCRCAPPSASRQSVLECGC